MIELKPGVVDRLKDAADKGDADSQYLLAVMYDEIVEYRNKVEAFKYYTLAAQNGIAEAQYRLGSIYYYNKDFILKDIDLELAFKYYKLAADNGYGPAQYKIADIYDFGLNRYDHETGRIVTVIDANRLEALKYYRLAANNGVRDALIRGLEITLEDERTRDFDTFYTIASNSSDEKTRIYAYNLQKNNH